MAQLGVGIERNANYAEIGDGPFATNPFSGRLGEFGSAACYLTPVLAPQHQNCIFHWIDIALQLVRREQIALPRAAYCLAMPMIAGFLATNALEGQYDDPMDLGEGPAGADPEISYAIAFATVAEHLFGRSLQSETLRYLDDREDGDGKSRAVVWGRNAGHKILALRQADGSDPGLANYNLGRYTRLNHVMRWVSPSPNESRVPDLASRMYSLGISPGHGQIRPWTVNSGSRFRSGIFHNPASPEFAEDFDLLRSVGGVNSRVRTADQTRSILFWQGGPRGLTVSGHFLLIAIQALQDRGLDFLNLARAFALLGAAQCDASIHAWDSKYFFDVMRPETAIRIYADGYSNPDSRVLADRDWCSAIATPEYPSYISAHSAIGATVTELIKLLTGSDQIRLEQESPDHIDLPSLKGHRRQWSSLTQIAEESGFSRIFGGVNWKIDHDHAMEAGRSLARNAFDTFLQPRI
ncbi:vanadium-dependent haloperoxidase [Parasphingorhabdus sp.]|uniref:vanadium-dependent haloperoxidase n=1 Tax=Parasphingorhabdus sp. TaxID=2709688 RepID=UPI0032640724